LASLWELVNAKLQDVVPEHPIGAVIVKAPDFANPTSSNLEYKRGKSSS